MNSASGIWGWTDDIGRLGFTLTLSMGLAAHDVLERYGVPAAGIELLTREQSWSRLPVGNATQLRAGTLGRWGFCFEERGTVGIRTSTLLRLSVDTETIAFLVAEGDGSFVHIKDGEGVEAFGSGVPAALRGTAPQTFWSATQKIIQAMARSGPVTPAHAVLQAIAKHVRAALDRQTLEGPLLTGFLADDATAELATTESGSGRPPAPVGRPDPGVGPSRASSPNHRSPPRGGHPRESPPPPGGGEVYRDMRRPTWPPHGAAVRARRRR